jgi:hypothetical protein
MTESKRAQRERLRKLTAMERMMLALELYSLTERLAASLRR